MGGDLKGRVFQGSEPVKTSTDNAIPRGFFFSSTVLGSRVLPVPRTGLSNVLFILHY